MQNAAYGIYKNGKIIFSEPVNDLDESKVIVVFLDKQINAPTHSNNKLLNIFDTLGAWEDSKDTEAIISEIEKTRVSKTTDFVI